MAELTQKERLQPSLLDRLTDDKPHQHVEGRDERIISPSRLRESVRRDLAWLFNTPNLESVQSLKDYPEVASSVVNYGLPPLAGRAASSIDLAELERRLRETILAFEPRLNPQALRVQVVSDTEEMSNRALSFYIEAELWAQPIPLRLFLKTDIDLETGTVAVNELPGGP